MPRTESSMLYYHPDKRVFDRTGHPLQPFECVIFINHKGIFVQTPEHKMIPVATQETGRAICQAWHEDRLGYYLAVKELTNVTE